MAKNNNDKNIEKEKLVIDETPKQIKANRKVKLISRLDYPVIINYGNSKKRLSPRHNEILELNKLSELPDGIKLIEINEE